jgi:uroporphyrinogen decarboxylase
MNHRERFIAALERRIPDYVPTFELVYYLTMELLGKVHPSHRRHGQWGQMSEREKRAQIDDAADVYLAVARRYKHSAIFIHGIGGVPDSELRTAEAIRHKSDDEYFLMCHGDTTLSVPNGDVMEEFSYRVADEPDAIKSDQHRRLEERLEWSLRHASSGLFDGFALCADYCFNTNPFFSPGQFAEFVTPFLRDLVAGYRSQGYYVIKHTDGNIMPVIDQIVSCKPHALHSLDPQAGVDIAEIKGRYGNDLCLIGNVNCGLLQTGTDEEVVESARYALLHGKPGGGYVFSTSNCVYTGMAIERYELMLSVWETERRY